MACYPRLWTLNNPHKSMETENNSMCENTFKDPDWTLQEREKREALYAVNWEAGELQGENVLSYVMEQSCNCPGTKGGDRLQTLDNRTTSKPQQLLWTGVATTGHVL